jgi:hypothetical protein
VFPRSDRTIRIGAPRRAPGEVGVRITADVDGAPAWFESAQVDLTAPPEAFPSAFLIPALHRGARLQLDAPVDPQWLAQMDPLLGILRAWWRYPRLIPEAATAAPAGAAGGARTALFFSGGVDSFYSLLRGGRPVHLLVMLQGFDYTLADQRRHAAAERTLREVAESLGIGWAVLRNNVREHPVLASAPWERTHGGILAAAAHLLPDDVGEVLISSSIAATRDQPWGSHWRVDPLWSTPRRSVLSVGHEIVRPRKLERIADEPLPQAHLRVCWENGAVEGNCSRCYKCVLTRLVLAEAGVLDRFQVLDGMETLAADVDAVPRGRERMRQLEDLVRRGQLGPEITDAVRRLIRRTRRLNSLPIRWRRALIRWMVGWTQPARP